MRIWITHVCSNFVDVFLFNCVRGYLAGAGSGLARSKPQFLTAVQILKFFRQTQVYVWMDYQLFNFGNVLDTQSSKPSKGNLEHHTSERVILSHSHLDNCVFESIGHVPRNISNNSQSNSSFSKTMRQ